MNKFKFLLNLLSGMGPGFLENLEWFCRIFFISFVIVY